MQPCVAPGCVALIYAALYAAPKKANFLHGCGLLQRTLEPYDSTDLLPACRLSGRGVTPAAFLAHLLELEGVLDAALINGLGAPLELLSDTQPLAASQKALTTCLASDRVLAELLGAETPTQTVLEFSSETVLLSISADLAGEPYRVVALCAAQDMSRVRFGLRRLLPQVVPQSAIPSISDTYA